MPHLSIYAQIFIQIFIKYHFADIRKMDKIKNRPATTGRNKKKNYLHL